MSDSLITKKAIAQSLKELMLKKSFDKITVADIATTCGLNRQTFYYHFSDKYELLNWIFYHEAISLLTQDLTLDCWNQNVLNMLNVMSENAKFYQNALKVSSRSEFEGYLVDVAKVLFCEIVEKLSENKPIAEADKKFIADFYSYGIVGIIVSWAKSGMRETAEQLTDHLMHLVNDSKSFAVRRYLEQHDTLE